MLTNDPIVQVSVFASSASASATAFDTGLILYPKANAADADRLKTYTSSTDMLSDGFTASDEAYQAAVKYFAASPAPSRLLVSGYPSAETPAQAFAAVLERSASFYGIYLCDATDEKILALAAAVREADGHFVLFYAVVGTPAEAISSSGLFAAVQQTGSRRALGVLAARATDAAAVMGTAMGLALNRRDTAFALCYKKINGMEPISLTESQVTSIKALNGNVYIARGYSRNMLENGAVASGLRFDEVMYIDRIAADLQEAAVALLADGLGKLPQTDETSAVFINRFSAILSSYTAMGVLATSVWRGNPVGNLATGDMLENGFMLWADSYDTQSDSDRAAHRAMPIHCALCMAGSVESLVLDIDVTV